MQYNVSTTQEYIEILVDDWRKEKLMALREIILNNANDIEEGLQYKMLSYGDERGIFCHLNAQKNFVALYVGNIQKIDADGSLLKGINCGKGCLRFKKTDDVTSTNIKSFINRTIQMWKNGSDIAC